MATKKLSRSEILRLIKEEEKKIEIAKDRKDSFLLVEGQGTKSNKPKTKKSTVKISSSKKNKRKSSVTSKKEENKPSKPTFLYQDKDEQASKSVPPKPTPRPEPKSEVKLEKTSENINTNVSDSNSENDVSKDGKLRKRKIIFATVTLIIGLLLIALIVIIILGISSGWHFWR